MCWVGPVVAVMEVNHHRHAIVLSAESQFKHVFLVAKTVFRLYPHTQTDAV